MEYINEFLSARKLDGLAESTLCQYGRELKIFYKHINKSTLNITTNELRNYFYQFHHLSQRSINRKISTLKAFYQWLINEEYIEKNPMRKIKTPKEPKTLPDILSEQEFEKLRYAPKTIRNRAIFELLSSTGMRISEMLALNINDIDLENRRIKVLGKGSKERIVYFTHIAKFCLINYLNNRKDNNPALFINKYNNRLGKRSVEMQTKSEAEKAGIRKKVTPHLYRHFMASRLYENNCSLEIIGKLLGHESINTTKIYAHISNSSIAKAYDKYST